VKVIPDTAPGIAGTSGVVYSEALSWGQGQPGLMAIHVGYRVYWIEFPVFISFITELSNTPGRGP
jgi:hypothetical protein